MKVGADDGDGRDSDNGGSGGGGGGSGGGMKQNERDSRGGGGDGGCCCCCGGGGGGGGSVCLGVCVGGDVVMVAMTLRMVMGTAFNARLQDLILDIHTNNPQAYHRFAIKQSPQACTDKQGRRTKGKKYCQTGQRM